MQLWIKDALSSTDETIQTLNDQFANEATELITADQNEEIVPMEEIDHHSENSQTVEEIPFSTVDVESMARKIVMEVLCCVDQEILMIETKDTTGLLDENSSHHPIPEAGSTINEVDQIEDKKTTNQEHSK